MSVVLTRIHKKIAPEFQPDAQEHSLSPKRGKDGASGALVLIIRECPEAGQPGRVELMVEDVRTVGRMGGRLGLEMDRDEVGDLDWGTGRFAFLILTVRGKHPWLYLCWIFTAILRPRRWFLLTRPTLLVCRRDLRTVDFLGSRSSLAFPDHRQPSFLVDLAIPSGLVFNGFFDRRWPMRFQIIN
jgi:hypothetical protein